MLQETIHSFKFLKGKKGFMILKLDLEKAYNRMEWHFGLESLTCLGIPSELEALIFKCMSTTSMSVNWNGSVTNTFNSSRGLR